MHNRNICCVYNVLCSWWMVLYNVLIVILTPVLKEYYVVYSVIHEILIKLNCDGTTLYKYTVIHIVK